MSPTVSLDFYDETVKEAIRGWWIRLQENDRGGRAELRRCRAAEEPVFCRAYHSLYQRLVRDGRWRINRDGLAAAAGVAAHLKTDIPDGASLARVMARPRIQGGEGARVSGLRFRRLIQIRNRVELYPALIRVLSLAGSAMDVTTLVRDAYYWNDPVRKNWAFEYYANAAQED